MNFYDYRAFIKFVEKEVFQNKDKTLMPLAHVLTRYIETDDLKFFYTIYLKDKDSMVYLFTKNYLHLVEGINPVNVTSLKYVHIKKLNLNYNGFNKPLNLLIEFFTGESICLTGKDDNDVRARNQGENGFSDFIQTLYKFLEKN